MLETIYITTPCLNARKTIDRTILSVVTQAGDFLIRYHVQDGGSTDGTLERLQWWQRRLASRGFPLSCAALEFSFASEPDTGMYDAIDKGFETVGGPANAFLTWINADDILMPGALAFIEAVATQFTPQQVSWVSGASAILRGDLPIANSSIPLPTAAIAAGICDGMHWNFLQQEGTFFRRWMWTSVDAKTNVLPLKLAGDWNLWRLFAGKSSLVLAKFPLASFRITQDQLSARQREKYFAEIDTLLPEATRRDALKSLSHAQADIRYRYFKINYSDARMTVVDDGANGLALLNCQKIFGDKAPSLPVNKNTVKVVTQGSLFAREETADPEAHISCRHNIAAYDRDWQFPAITEQHAYHQIRDAGQVPDSVTYVAYPWANLIDKLQTKAPDAKLHLDTFDAFLDTLPKNTVRITTCQHVKMRDFLRLFEKAEIRHVFWSHATEADAKAGDGPDLQIHPFPLYPVQIPEAGTLRPIAERAYLFSFIGAKSNQYYLTRAREWILDLLVEHPRGLIIGRDNWHYNKVVYEHQIRRVEKNANAADLVDKSASEQFKISMAQSIFSLCPSGSGPNSIRLWETLGAGAIPVILADSYAPPGDPALWQAGAVFCDETPEAIKALPARLEEIAADPARLEAMCKVGAQLWLLYGPQSFVYDIQKLMLQLRRGLGGGAGQSQNLPLRETLATRIAATQTVSERDAESLLRVCSSDLLLEGKGLLRSLENDVTALGQMVTLAREALPKTHPTLSHYRNVVAHVQSQPARKTVSAPRVGTGSGPRIAFVGRHSNRTPFSYPAFQQTLGNRIQVERDPFRADVIMTGFNLDLKENSELFETIARESPATRIMVISEEPLWDSLWSGGFADRARTIRCGQTDVSYTYLNHSNSDIFAFDQVPYFLLTNDDLLARYSLLIHRHSTQSAQALLAHWQAAPISAAFVAERREGEKYATSCPEQGVYGLSSYRSDVAAATRGPTVLREGKGWHSDQPRQMLPDWHLDKLATLDGQVRVLSSFENTHQKNYISEKILDAFAVGGIPTYFADKDHSIKKLVPSGCMINGFDRTAEDVAREIEEPGLDSAMAELWLETARTLQKLLGDADAVHAERLRVVNEILDHLQAA